MTQIVERTLWDGADAEELLSHSMSTLVRTSYFAIAADAAMRYRVSVTEVVDHLISAGICRVSRPERAADNLRCVVHATALVRGDAQAWADLMNSLAPSFDRACAARLDPVEGIAFARKFWLDLRQCSVRTDRRDAGTCTSKEASKRFSKDSSKESSREGPKHRGTRAPDLRGYTGLRPLRYWLAERLLGSLEQELGRAGRTHRPALATHGQARLERVYQVDRVQQARTLRIPSGVITAEAKAF